MENLAKQFRDDFERFLIACDAMEEENRWDLDEYGEMEAYFLNDFACAAIRLIASDGTFKKEEVEYLNEYLGFTYSVEELSAVYEMNKEHIDSFFETGIPDSKKELAQLNPELSDLYGDLMRALCEVIIAGDGVIAEKERKEAERLKEMV